MVTTKHIATLFLALGFVCVGFIERASAHYIWIEPAGTNQAKVYFGEFDEGLREKAGGRLDEFSAVEFWHVTAKSTKPVSATLEKKEDHFLVSGMDKSSVFLAQDLSLAVKDLQKHDLGTVKPMFYARFQKFGDQRGSDPLLDLDIVLTDKNAYTLFFKKKPLAEAKVTIYAPNGWKQEHKTDENGQVALKTPWSGQYVLDVVHKEAAPGSFGGTDYQAVRHRATSAFILP